MADNELENEGKEPIDPKELDEMSGGSSNFLKLDDTEKAGATEEFLKLD